MPPKDKKNPETPRDPNKPPRVGPRGGKRELRRDGCLQGGLDSGRWASSADLHPSKSLAALSGRVELNRADGTVEEFNVRLPNEAEVLLYAFLVASIDWSVADLDQWAKKVLLEEARRKSLGPDWLLL